MFHQLRVYEIVETNEALRWPASMITPLAS